MILHSRKEINLWNELSIHNSNNVIDNIIDEFLMSCKTRGVMFRQNLFNDILMLALNHRKIILARRIIRMLDLVDIHYYSNSFLTIPIINGDFAFCTDLINLDMIAFRKFIDENDKIFLLILKNGDSGEIIRMSNSFGYDKSKLLSLAKKNKHLISDFTYNNIKKYCVSLPKFSALVPNFNKTQLIDTSRLQNVVEEIESEKFIVSSTRTHYENPYNGSHIMLPRSNGIIK
jgi:hypothetical protein